MATFIQERNETTTISFEEDVTENISFITQRPVTRSVMPPDWYKWVIIWYYIPITLGLPSNLMAIITFVRSPLMLRIKPVNYLVFNLALSDFVICLFAQFHILLNFTTAGLRFISHHKYACLVTVSAVQIPTKASLVSLLMLSCERLIAVLWPLHHLQLVTRNIVKCMICLSWVLLGASVSVPFGWNLWREGLQCVGAIIYPYHYHVYFVQLPLYTCLGITSIFNIIIAVVALRRHRSLSKCHRSHLTTSEKSLEATKTREKKAENKVIMMLLMVVGVFFLSWLPVKIAGTVVQYVYGGKPPETVHIILQSVRGLQLMHLVADPIIYIRQTPQCKQAFYHMWCCQKEPEPRVSANMTTSFSDKAQSRGKNLNDDVQRY